MRGLRIDWKSRLLGPDPGGATFVSNNRVNKQTSMQKDARKDGHKPSSVIVDKVLRERLRLVRFVVEDQLEESFARRRHMKKKLILRGGETATGIINTIF